MINKVAWERLYAKDCNIWGVIFCGEGIGPVFSTLWSNHDFGRDCVMITS